VCLTKQMLYSSLTNYVGIYFSQKQEMTRVVCFLDVNIIFMRRSIFHILLLYPNYNNVCI